jgi:hypothetical protein
MPAQPLILSGAGDPSTFSFRDSTPQQPTAPSSPEQQFQNEWDMAQQRYRAGINSGYNEDDADKLYLSPVRDKWEVLKDVPDAMKPGAAKELDAAQAAYLKGVNSGYKPADAGKIFLKPAEEKWIAAASLPEKKKLTIQQQFAASPEHQYEAQQDEQSALSDIAGGKPVRKVIESYPLLLSMPGYSTRWNARYNSALNHDQTTATQALHEKTAAEKLAEKAASPDVLRAQVSKLFSSKVPPEMEPDKAARIGQLENQITNSPARVSFSAPPEDMTKKDKVSLAQKIAADHPDWSKAQVILAVQGKLKGAE